MCSLDPLPPLTLCFCIFYPESERPREVADQSGLSVGTGVGIGISVFVVSTLLVMVVLFFLVAKISSQRNVCRQSSKHLKNVSLTFSSFGKEPTGPETELSMEFSRDNLELHNQIGECVRWSVEDGEVKVQPGN
jgi:hypothetical protein